MYCTLMPSPFTDKKKKKRKKMTIVSCAENILAPHIYRMHRGTLSFLISFFFFRSLKYFAL